MIATKFQNDSRRLILKKGFCSIFIAKKLKFYVHFVENSPNFDLVFFQKPVVFDCFEINKKTLREDLDMVLESRSVEFQAI